MVTSMMNSRIRATLRAVETAREFEGGHPAIEPLDIDMEQLRSITHILEQIYSPGQPTYQPPVVRHIPKTYSQVQLKTIADVEVPVYSSPDHSEIILLDPVTGKLVKYKLYRKMNADEKPIFDTYYLTRIRQGEWGYYMPAGREFEDFDAGREIVTSTHYLIDWDTGTIIDYPYGSMAGPGDNVIRNRNKMRAVVLAGLVEPKLFKETATKYLNGTITENDLYKILEKASAAIVETRTINTADDLKALYISGAIGFATYMALLPLFIVAEP